MIINTCNPKKQVTNVLVDVAEAIMRIMRGRHFIRSAAAAGTYFLFLSCSSPPKNVQPTVLSSSSSTAGGVVITDEMIGRRLGEMLLSQASIDPSYAFSEHAPVLIGGGFGSGSDRTYRYLNSLRSPNGEPFKYDRIGTCCPFKSANSPFGDEALLEVYQLTIPGVGKKRIYFNWYETADVLIPIGLAAAR
jgi:hypothetical protein